MLTLVVAVMVAGSGCGSRASDEEIASALRAGQPAGVLDQSAVGLDGVQTEAAAAKEAVSNVSSSTGTAASDTTSPVASSTSAPATKAPGTKVRPTPATSLPTPLLADKSVVKIGQVGPFSGVFGAVTGVAPRALAAWVASTNAHEGLNGHPMQLIVGDDQGDPATALTLTRRMVESDKILAMAGNINVFGFPQIEKYMREKNVPMLGDGIDELWFKSPVAFPVAPSAVVQSVKGIKAFTDEGTTKVAILYCLEVGAICSAVTEAVKKSDVGRYIVQDYQVSLVAPSYTSQCIRMKQGGIELVYLMMDTAGAARAAQDCANQGFKPKIMLLGLDATAEMPKIPALSSAFVPGATVPPSVVGLPALDKYRQVLGTYAPRIGDSGFGAYAYAAGEMLGAAGKALPPNPSSADFFAGLWKLKDETLGGFTVPVTYAKGKGLRWPSAFSYGVPQTASGRPRRAGSCSVRCSAVVCSTLGWTPTIHRCPTETQWDVSRSIRPRTMPAS